MAAGQRFCRSSPASKMTRGSLWWGRRSLAAESRGGPDITARGLLERWIILVAELIRRRKLWPATLGDPRSPVLPPGGIHQLRIRFPYLRIGGKTVVHPMLGLRIWRIDNTRDVP